MLGTVHNLMIRHILYKGLPHREGGGGAGHVTSPKQEFRRQLRVARKVDVFGLLALHAYQQHARSIFASGVSRTTKLMVAFPLRKATPRDSPLD
jgi:hypothetical protein